MSVERYPSNDTARRSRDFRAIRPHGKPPGYQKDFTPRDKRGRPLKDREGIKKPKQIPKGLPKAAQQMARSLIRARVGRAVQLVPEAVKALNRLDNWSNSWVDWNFGDWFALPGDFGLSPYWQKHECGADTGLREDLGRFVAIHSAGVSDVAPFQRPQFWNANGSADWVTTATPETTTQSNITFYEWRNTFRSNGNPFVYVASHYEKTLDAPSPTPVFVSTPGIALPGALSGTELTFEFPLEWPVPNRWLDAVAEPGSQPAGDPAPKKQPSRKDAQAETARVPLVPGLGVVLVPVTEVVPVPDSQVITVPPSPNAPVTVVTRPPPETISRVPRGRRVKERKLTLMAAAPLTWAIINFGTEAMDFLGVLHDALPEDLRAKKKSGWSKPKAHEMAEAVYRHYDRIDLATAVENYVNEWIEDQWFGRSGIAGKKLNQMTGNSTGADRALTQGGAGPGEAPEVHLDVDTGEWEVTTPWGNFSGNMSGGGIDYNT